MLHDNETFELDGLTFVANFRDDIDSEPPWERNDGHGIVSEWTTRAKRPGERILSSDNGSHRYYDFAGTLEIAHRDSWGIRSIDSARMTKRQITAAAVEQDYAYLKGWCNNDWYYCSVRVTLLNTDGKRTYISESLSGIESNEYNYQEEVTLELAGEISAELGTATEIQRVIKHQIRKEEK